MSGEAKDVVVVTGAAAGLGRAIARAFGQLGCDVGLIARGIDGLEGARREIEQMGRRAVVCPLDVSNAQALEDAAQKIEEELGPITIWVNNAMLSVFSPVKEMKAEEYKRVTEVTYLGYVYGTLSALKRMLPRDRGTIVQVGSALAYRAIPLQSAYSASKHAIQGFTESLRSELIHDKSHVRVTMVQMPAMNTPQFDWVKSRLPRQPQPVPPIYQPEVGAEAVVWAAYNERRELYVGWPTEKAIWGNKVAPGYADKYLAEHGYASQQTDVPADLNQPNNLWAPLPGDYGARGRFDERSYDWSFQLWATTHRAQLAAAVAVGAAVVAGLASLFKGRGNGKAPSKPSRKPVSRAREAAVQELVLLRSEV